MTKFGISQPVRRVEDVRFLKGAGSYIEDLTLENQARAFVLRSPVAHADFTISVDDAKAADGVLMS